MVRKKLKRSFILFICFLLAFSSFGAISGGQVSAQEEKYFYEDDEVPDRDKEETRELPLKEGDEDEQVIILKERLILAGFYELEEEQELDARFDEQLRDAVTEFQSSQELETTGEYDETTQNLLADYLENELNILYSIDDESEEITDLKMTLSFIGYGNFPEEPSPYFGQLTKQIVEEFQETEELEVTGAINEETLEVLMSLVEEYDEEHTVNTDLEESESTEEEAAEEDTVTEEEPDEKETEEKEIDKSPDTEESKESSETEDKEQSSETNVREEENSVKDEEEAEEKEEAAEEESNETEEIDESDPAADENQDASGETNEEAEKTEQESLEPESDKDGEKREEKDLEDSEETDSSAFSMSLMTVEEPLALPYEDGDSGEDIVTVKQDLTRLGFGNFPSVPSNRYGPVTMGVVEEFQKYYGLNATGITDEETYDRIAAELSTIYRDGQADEDIVELKKKLTVLGYGNFPSSPSNRYGPVTEGVVKEFQYSENLRVNGIGDSVTVALLEERYLEEWYATASLTLPYQNGDSGEDIDTLKQDLTRLGFGNFPSSPSTRYGPVTMGVVKDFQEYYGLSATGETDQETYDRIVAELNTIYRDGQADEDITELKEKLTYLGYGNFPEDPSVRYGPVTEGVVTEFQSSEDLTVNGIGDSVTVALLETRYLEERYATVNLTLPYEDGDSGDDIVTLKQDLTRLGFGNFPSSPSPRYGPVTMGVVRDFQEYYGLNVTGETDKKTYDRIAAELNTIYRDGQAHKDIVSFKQDLTRLGYGNFPEEPSNRYGPVTEGVLLEFQKAEELVENGIGDSITMGRLKERTLEYHNANLSLPYENGDVGDLIRELKIDLTTLGFGNFPSSPSNRYGPVTMGVVEDFQNYYGLNATGITDQRTMNQLKQELNTIYRDGQAHDDIVGFKQDLTQLGYGNFPSLPSNRYGSVTSGVVSEFQESQELVVNGIGDSVTLAKIESLLPDLPNLGKGVVTASNLNVRQGPGTSFSIIGTLANGTEVNLLEDTGHWYRISHSSITASPAYVSKTYIREVSDKLSVPYKDGDAGDEIVELKKNLTTLGFGNFPESPSNRYGSVTEGVVKVFQDYYGLAVTGEAEQATLDYIDEVLASSYQEGKSHEGVRDLKLNLTRLGFGNFSSNPSNSYGSVTAGVVREFQAYHHLVVNGIGDPVTLMKINSELNKQGGTGYTRSYDMTIEQMLDRQMTLGPQTDLYGGGWQNAKREDVRYYLDPLNFSLDPSSRDMYQFLKLSQTSGVSATQLNKILSGKGILHHTGATFKDAAERNGVNDIYLISHALLETGHGTSILSNGSIEVGQVSTNKWVSIRPTSSGKATYILERVYNDRLNRWSWVRTRDDNFDTNGMTLRQTYNMFGIEAVDSDPYTRGSVRAFREGWFTPEASIRGGAQFISNNYLERGQDTLYKMRWDPDFHEAAVSSDVRIARSSFYQYATDIGWAYKQTRMIKSLYDQIENPYLPLEVPNYKR
ncbi:peptidoglycan-binding protein [Salipaludibacillus aurantiacus]|uniref:Beta-N-acetylglucosaminidase n=1 Tax=Salipaludibacillus aurantiacus TaxID=1601833 RepID=A0A1H9X4P5_9BACI|nr:peptidoglycan-binding protein [Salipaludibacillus aurantiacus]SES41166.1 Beta-N-acetylglucosaminidase [Salipaludibacillus aurantiacus]